MSQIYGIGTDICDIRRIRAAFDRHGERFAQKVLSEAEMQTFRIRSARWPDRVSPACACAWWASAGLAPGLTAGPRQ